MYQPRSRYQARLARRRRIRRLIAGTAARPRVAVFRSARHLSAQAIDDQVGRTLAAAGDLKGADAKTTKTARAADVGRELGRRLVKLGVSTIVFDRGGYRYHGRVQACAEALREQGLTF